MVRPSDGLIPFNDLMQILHKSLDGVPKNVILSIVYPNKFQQHLYLPESCGVPHQLFCLDDLARAQVFVREYDPKNNYDPTGPPRVNQRMTGPGPYVLDFQPNCCLSKLSEGLDSAYQGMTGGPPPPKKRPDIPKASPLHFSNTGNNKSAEDGKVPPPNKDATEEDKKAANKTQVLVGKRGCPENKQAGQKTPAVEERKRQRQRPTENFDEICRVYNEFLSKGRKEEMLKEMNKGRPEGKKIVYKTVEDYGYLIRDAMLWGLDFNEIRNMKRCRVESKIKDKKASKVPIKTVEEIMEEDKTGWLGVFTADKVKFIIS